MRFNEHYLIEEPVKCFNGVCDRVRKTPEGEAFWQDMMKHKEEISEEEFLQNVDPSEILDDDETWEEYLRNAQRSDPDFKFYKSKDGVYFFQTAGFEFIFKEGKLK